MILTSRPTLALLSVLAGTVGLYVAGPDPAPAAGSGIKADAATLPLETVQQPAPAAYVLPALQSFRVVTDRPVFSANRRPVMPKVAGSSVETSPEPVSVPRLTVNGLVSSGGRAVAVVKLEGGNPQIVAENDSVAGWKVAAVLADRVILARNGRTIDIALTRHGNKLGGADLVSESRKPVSFQSPGS